jgi:protein gp37
MFERKATAATPIEWQPVMGCSHASPGCTNCKAATLAPNDMREEFVASGLVTGSKAGPVWTGAVHFSGTRLSLPTETVPPTEFVVCPHGDLFHENVPTAWIDRVFDQIEACPRHTFQVLTKRAARMQGYVGDRYATKAPPARVVFGVSCERQVEADERIPLLLQTPAARRMVTLFPLLGPIDLSPHLAVGGINFVVGGPEAERPVDPAWAHAIRRQCSNARVHFVWSNMLVGSQRAA